MQKRLLYLATQNQHKAAELSAILGEDRWEIRTAAALDPQMSWEESGSTFVANARIKALKLKQYTQAAVLADDSGLCVAALAGAPGVYSSRYAGREGDAAANNAKLLRELSDVSSSRRMAEFVCCLYFIDEQDRPATFTGSCRGLILDRSRGEQGFGYDPLFYLPTHGKTMAELSSNEKNEISHRGQALKAFQASIPHGPI